MRWYEVASSVIDGFGYDVRTETLTVTFRSGAVYNYYRVPARVRRGLRDTPSKGRYFAKKVRNAYEYQRVG